MTEKAKEQNRSRSDLKLRERKKSALDVANCFLEVADLLTRENRLKQFHERNGDIINYAVQHTSLLTYNAKHCELL